MTNKKVTLILFTIITLISCEDKQPNELVITNYPMSIGTSWTYEKLWILRNYKSVTSDSIVNSDTIKIKGTVRIVKDTIINKIKLSVFKTQEIANNNTTTMFQYYNLDKDGLKCYAYKNEEVILPDNSTIGSNEIFIYKTPILNIKYPLTINSEWISDSSADNGIPVTKKVIETGTLLINGQKYACLKTTYNYPSGNTNISTTQWISKEGLLKEETDFGTLIVYPFKYGTLMYISVLSLSIK